MKKRNDAAMTEHDDDNGYDRWNDTPPRRSHRTRFREKDDRDEKMERRNKRSGKRSHRPKTHKDDFWPDEDD